MITRAYKTYQEFQARENKQENGVSIIFSKKHPTYLLDNDLNEGCFNCMYCIDCIDCLKCTNCKNAINFINAHNIGMKK